MKRTFSLRPRALVVVATGLIAATYGLVRLAYGLMLPDVRAELGVDTATAGLISAGASAMYCVGALVGLVLAAARPRALIVAAAATAGLGAIAMAAAPDVALFGAATVLSSAGAGLASPALVTVIGRNVRPASIDTAQASVNAGTGVGLVAAGAMALVLLPDWRIAWGISGVVTLLFGALVLAADRGPATPGTDRQRRRTVLPPRSWYVDHIRLIVAALLMGAASAAVWNSGRAVLTEAGVGRTLSITAWVFLGAGGIAVIVTAGRVGRLHPSRAWALTTAAVALGTATLVAAPQIVPVALLACALFGWGYTAGTGALIAWTSRIDPDRAASGTAMLFVVLVLGQAVGAAAAGIGTDLLGSGPVFVMAAAVAAVSAASALTPSGRVRTA